MSTGDAVCIGVLAERVLSVEGVPSALTATLLPWLRSLTTPCSSAADLFGNLNGEGESRAAPWEPCRSGLPSFIVEDAITSGNVSRAEIRVSLPLKFVALKKRKAPGERLGRNADRVRRRQRACVDDNWVVALRHGIKCGGELGAKQCRYGGGGDGDAHRFSSRAQQR